MVWVTRMFVHVSVIPHFLCSFVCLTCLPEIGTFLVTGHETTSTAMSWTLFGLCKNLEAQGKLRKELLTLQTDNPTMDELKSLPYLDMVVRESLRLYAPAFTSRRVAVKDTVLPMRDGSSIRCVRFCPNILSIFWCDPPRSFMNSISEGDKVLIPIYAMNTDRDVWGEDSLEFRCAFSRMLTQC